MPHNSLPDYLKGAKQIFKGSRFDFYLAQQITKNGERHHREIVIHPGAVVILPMLSDDSIVFIKNYRIATGEILIELPAGTREDKEDPMDTAKRELIEETGYECDSIVPLNHFYTTPGFCNEMMHAFLATGLRFLGQKLDPSEEIDTEVMTIDQAVQNINNGTIKDGKTIATFLYFYNFIYKR